MNQDRPRLQFTLWLGLMLGLTPLAGCSQAPQAAAAHDAAPAAVTEGPVPDEGQVTPTSAGLQAISPIYHVDRIYKSMTGPWSSRQLRLLDGKTPELVWITGSSVQMVAADGVTPMPEQFMCHTNFDFDGDWHNDLFQSTTPLDGRLFTLSQGQLSVQFPPGFGIPVMSNEIIDLSTQVINLNVKDRAFDVRHKVDISFVRDSAAPGTMKPLYERALMGMVSLEGRGLVPDQKETTAAAELFHAAHGPCLSCCVPGMTAIEGYEHSDTLGQRFSTHWIIKPGREENHTRVTKMMALPFDTTLHFLAVHIHPFAESLELRDVTADRSLFKSHVRNVSEGIGVADVEYFASAVGIPVYRDHEYELVSIYNNTTAEDQDSMAVMYAYFLDQNYRGPDTSLAQVRRETGTLEGDLDDTVQAFNAATGPTTSPEAGPICNAEKK